MCALLSSAILSSIGYAGGLRTASALSQTARASRLSRNICRLIRLVSIVRHCEDPHIPCPCLVFVLSLSCPLHDAIHDLANHLTVYPECLKVFEEHYQWIVKAAAVWKGVAYAWEVREVALLIFEDYAFGKPFLLKLRSKAVEIIDSRMLTFSAARLSPAGQRYIEDEIPECHVRHQCDAAIVAGDVVWLRVTPPAVMRARSFFLENAPETPNVPTDSEDNDGDSSWR